MHRDKRTATEEVGAMPVVTQSVGCVSRVQKDGKVVDGRGGCLGFDGSSGVCKSRCGRLKPGGW